MMLILMYMVYTYDVNTDSSVLMYTYDATTDSSIYDVNRVFTM